LLHQLHAVMPDLAYLEDKSAQTSPSSECIRQLKTKATAKYPPGILRHHLKHPVGQRFRFLDMEWRLACMAGRPFILIIPWASSESTYSGEGNRQKLPMTSACARKIKAGSTLRPPYPAGQDKQPQSVSSFPAKLATGVTVRKTARPRSTSPTAGTTASSWYRSRA